MAKYDITKTKKLKFARFGGLSSVNQKGYDPEPRSMHSPPCRRGFYAFVWPYYEMFLLGGYANQVWKPGSKFTYIRDKDGKVVDSKHPEFETFAAKDGAWQVDSKKYAAHMDQAPDSNDPSYWDRCDDLRNDWDVFHADEAKWVLAEKPSPRIFEFDKELWHHLSSGLKQHQIVGRYGDWVKSSVQDFRVALEKEMHKARADEMVYFSQAGRLMPSIKSPFRYYCKDYLEVFIEKL
jgi:hypothetical protein